MSVNPETKRLWRTAAVVASVGLLALIPLVWLANRTYNDYVNRRVAAANEAAVIAALESISAAQHLYLQTYGQYATFPQMVEAGVFQAPLSGNQLVSSGYRFTLNVRPRAEAQQSSYSVNADPLRKGETGNRHFYIDSEVIGIRINADRPARPTDPPRQSVQPY